MKFKFEGNDYVIAFAHDKPRDWAAHEDHKVQLTRIIKPVELPGVSLFCVDCSLQLSHIPKALRDRLTECSIFQVSPIEGGIRKLEIASGTGRCNSKDRWTREGGRLAALRNALGFDADSELGWATQMSAQIRAFRAAAWEAYQTRHWNTQVEQLAAADRALAAARAIEPEGAL